MKHSECRIYSEININNRCKVKLTPYGVLVLRDYWKKYNIYILDAEFDEYIKRLSKDGWYQFQLWDFMHIFGKYMYMGSKNVIENNLMRIYQD